MSSWSAPHQETNVNALDILKEMHPEAHAAFAATGTAAPGDRAGRSAHLQTQLHEQIEEQYLYDPVAQEAGPGDPILARWENEHEEQVREADAVIARIDGLDPATDAWLETVNTLAGTLDEHIAHQENDIGPGFVTPGIRTSSSTPGRQMVAARAAADSGASVPAAVKAGLVAR